MAEIHLWDNSWHVKEQTDSSEGRYGRKPHRIKEFSGAYVLRQLSSSTIREMIEADGSNVIVWPQSIIEGYETIAWVNKSAAD